MKGRQTYFCKHLWQETTLDVGEATFNVEVALKVPFRTKVHAVGKRKEKSSVFQGKEERFLLFFLDAPEIPHARSVFVISGGGAHEVLLFLPPPKE